MTENKKCKGCDHNHGHNHNNEEISKIDIILYIISIVLFILGLFPIISNYKILVYLLVVILSGYKLILDGVKNILKLNFEENTLMTIAVIAAFILGEFPESAMVVLLFRLGEFLEEKAVGNSNKNIKNIVEIKAKTANLIKENNQIEIMNVEDIKIGDKILIKPGEMVPVDCKIIEGTSNLDTSNITGESNPVYVEENENILSGIINLTGSLRCTVTKDYKNSTASKIVDLVYEATNNKGKTEEFITRFSKIYTPVVVIIGILLAVIPTLIFKQDFKDWVMRALVFLVASCPCSIVISVPLAFFSCIGAISKRGMLIKGTKHIEALSKAKYIAFDKTGTITTGKMEIEKIVSINKMSQEEILIYMYALEKNSNHPISTAIAKKVEEDNLDLVKTVDKYEEIAGHGIKGRIDNKNILFGNRKLMDKYNIEIKKIEENANYLVVEDRIEGYIILKEEIRKDAINISDKFKKVNIKETIMLTGDNEKNANKIAEEAKISKVFASLLPQDKQERVKELRKDGKVIFVGDGINDSPVLAEADFGISIGEGTEIANSTADGILISNNISSIPSIIKIARKSFNIIKFNIVFSLIIKLIILSLGIAGIAPVWLAIVADTGVSLITVLNCVRIFENK